jgi:AcrR family transcriptional regulator
VAKKGQTRRLILAAARKTLAEDGLVGISTRRVAREAGVNQALVHYHFKTIQQLLLAVLIDVREEVAPALSQIFDDSKDFLSAWRIYARRVAGRDYPEDLSRIWLQSLTMAVGDPAMADAYWSDYFEPTHEAVTGSIARHFPNTKVGRTRTETLAALVMAVQRGVIIDRLLGSARGHQQLYEFMEEIITDTLQSAAEPAARLANVSGPDVQDTMPNDRRHARRSAT